MHVLVIVYQDSSSASSSSWPEGLDGGGGWGGAGYHLNPEKNYLMTSGRLSIRASISRWFLPLVCVVIAFGRH